jgi:hypothetical protein
MTSSESPQQRACGGAPEIDSQTTAHSGDVNNRFRAMRIISERRGADSFDDAEIIHMSQAAEPPEVAGIWIGVYPTALFRNPYFV